MTAWRESSTVYLGGGGTELPLLVFEPDEGSRSYPGVPPESQPGSRPGEHPRVQPGSQPEVYPGQPRPGSQPEVYPGRPEPGSQPEVHPEPHPGLQPGPQPGSQPGPQPRVLPRAGVILFHGGGLRMGSPEDLVPHCRDLAARGILAASAGYRLLGQAGAVGIEDCLADVRAAVAEFGRVAAELGVEASRVASGGSSAGAHLALVAGMKLPAGEPNVARIVALNPAGLDLASFDAGFQRRLEVEVGIAEGRLTEYSVIEYVRPGNVPVLIQHGTRDEVEPIDCVRRFRDAMVAAGNICALVEYEGAGHAFHYPGDDANYDAVIGTTERFLLG